MSDDIAETRKRYTDALDALREQREIIREDQAFTDPVSPQQWDETERIQRENDPGGSRPCLVFDQLGQYVENVAGQVEQRPPAMHTVPVDSRGDKRVAQQFEGIFRHIEYQSRAAQHYAVVERSAARVGVGYLTLRPEYVNRALNYQEPRIGSVGDPLNVVLDPWSVALDGSDAECGWILTPMSHGAFAREFGNKAERVSFGSTEAVKDDRDSIIVAEEWLTDKVTSNCIVVQDASGEEITLSEDDFWARQNGGVQQQYVRNYTEKKNRVKWRRMSGAKVFSESVYPASGIGIVPAYGYVGFADGRLKFAGMGRRARDQQRAYNYHKSEERALMSQLAKAPWAIDVRAFGGDEKLKQLWDRASIETRSYLPYHGWDAANNAAIQAPQKLQPSVDLRNHIMAAEEARNNIRAALGMYAPSLGEPSNETSGIAIQERKAQGDAATALFPANLAAAVSQVGKLCVEMVPRLIDTKRQQRILAMDGSASSVTVDPKQEQAVIETPDGLVINPNVGAYDVRVTIGSAYTTQRSQANQILGEIMARNPDMSAAVGPIWAMNLDFQGADKLAEVLIAQLPEPLRAIYKPEEKGKPTTEMLMQQVEQLRQGLQEAIQHAQDAQREADEAKDAAESKAEADAVAWFKAETERLKVTGANDQQVQAIVQDMLARMLSTPMPGQAEDQFEAADEQADALEPPEQPEEPQSPEMQLLPAGDGLGMPEDPSLMAPE